MLGPEVAYENGHDERSARQSEAQTFRYARYEEGNVGHEATQHDAQEDGYEVGVVEPLHLVAQHLLRVRHSQFGAHHRDAVAHLQLQVGRGEEVDTGTVHARDVGAEVGVGLHLRDALAVDARLGDEYAACYQFGAVLLPRHVYRLAQQRHDRLLYGGVCHDVYDVALVEHGAAVHHLLGAAAVLAVYLRNHEVAVQEVVYLLHRVAAHHLVGNLYGERVQRHRLQMAEAALGLLVLSLLVDAQRKAQDDERQNDAQHTHGVGYGIAGSDGGCVDVAQVAEGLLCCTQPRRVGDGTRHDARHGGDGRAGEVVDAQRHDDADGNDGDAEEVETLAAVLERGKETGTYLQTDGVDEEYQTELLQKVEQVLVEAEREMAEDKADEENPGQSERYAFYPDFAQTQAQRDDQCKDHDRMGYTASPEIGKAVKQVSDDFHNYVDIEIFGCKGTVFFPFRHESHCFFVLLQPIRCVDFFQDTRSRQWNTWKR